LIELPEDDKCYTRNEEFRGITTNYHTATDLTEQANHLGVTLQADLIKQKQANTNYGIRDLDFGKYNEGMYETLTTTGSTYSAKKFFLRS
jgi:class I fructose-bisphosphate aldolase